MTEKNVANAASALLAEASPSSLEEFFSRQPPFDETTLTALVSELRRKREVWETLGKGEKVTKKAPRAPAVSAQLSAEDLWSDDSEAMPPHVED